jgi:HD-GYP domain-containing protein (c-di-GMP phosphodiesterase class II)
VSTPDPVAKRDPAVPPLTPDVPKTDERTRRLGQALVAKLSAVLRVSPNYGSDDTLFLLQLAQLIDMVRPLLDQQGEAMLLMLDDDLYLNGVRIPVESHTLRFQRHVLEELERRRIAGLRLLRGVNPRHLGVLFRLFREPDVYHGAELLHACVARGADHLEPVVHATTDKPDDDFEYDGAPLAVGTEVTRHAGITGAVTGVGAEDPVESTPATPATIVANAVEGARAALDAATRGGMGLRHAKRVVQPLVDAACSATPVVLGLHALPGPDTDASAHAVHVTLVTIAMGRVLELERNELADLAVAALLHDVGKAAVAGAVRHPFDRYDETDWVAIHRHPIEGLKTIALSGTLDPATLRCMRVAFEHHMGPGAAGYPVRTGPWPVSAWSRMVSVADAFVSFQMHHVRGARVTPHQALGRMLGPLRDHFDPALLWVLVQSVGFYPPGQRVELDDHTIALALGPQTDDPARPHVRVLSDARGVALREPIELHPLPLARSIRRALPADEGPAEPLAAAA